MEKELGADVIKATQTSLGKYVKRPPLSEKLLRKPPFRFLHDIVISVVKSYGFFEGLFEEQELISENVKERESKISFLNKVITVIAWTTGKTVAAKPSKIVAGQEPDKTNEMLQCLAYALDQKLSSDEAVKKYKGNSKSQLIDVKNKDRESNKAMKKNDDSKKFTSRSSEKLTNNKKDATTVNKNEKNKISDSKTKKKENGLAKNETLSKRNQNAKGLVKKSSVEKPSQSTLEENSVLDLKSQQMIVGKKESTETEKIKSDNEEQNVNPKKVNDLPENTLNIEAIKSIQDDEVEGKLNSSYTIGENELNSSLSSQDLMEIETDKVENSKYTENSKEESTDIVFQDRINEINKEEIKVAETKKLPEESSEFTSIKPKPNLIQKHNSLDSELRSKGFDPNTTDMNGISFPTLVNRPNSGIVRPSSVRPSSSRPGAPRLRDKTDTTVADNDNLLLGKVNIIPENAPIDEEEDESVVIVDQHTGLESKVGYEQDNLQILSNEHGHLVQQILDSQKELTQVAGKTEIEWQFGAQKAKEASNQEIEQLRFNIQALSRVANPLGKLLDHIQEDVEVMRQELQQWTKVYEEVSKDMQQQKAASEESLIPLQTRIKQLDVDIVEKRDKINDLKILIHKNSLRIEKLLANGNVQ